MVVLHALVHDACFLSGLRKIETTFVDANASRSYGAQVKCITICNGTMIHCDFVVDISDFMEKKMEVSTCLFLSQFYDKKSNEPETPISSQQFLEQHSKAGLRI